MKSTILPNGLSRRTNHCLSKAGISIEKQAIAKALKSGKLYPYRWPPNYGRKTHDEVCRWAEVDPKSLSVPKFQDDSLNLNNGLSYRANRCLARAGIPASKSMVRHALQTGALWPGKRPGNYGGRLILNCAVGLGLIPYV